MTLLYDGETLNKVKSTLFNRRKPKYLSAWYKYVYMQADSTKQIERKIGKLKVHRVEFDHENKLVKAYVYF